MKTKFISTIAYFSVIGLTALAIPTICSADAKGQINNAINATNDGNTTDIDTSITSVINMILFIAGLVAVIMVIVGGIRYTTSNGDPSKVKAAKDTILYSVIGIAVAILAYAIINFVVDTLT